MKELRERIEEFALKSLASLMRILPRNVSLKIGENLGYLVFIIGIRKEVTLDNLDAAFPDKPQAELDAIAKACYRHFGALLAEFARLALLKSDNVDKYVEVEGWEVLEKAREDGKGGIVVSGHFGNWELMGSSVSVKGYPVCYVVTRQQNERVEKLMDHMRENTGITIIKRREAVKGVLKALQENKLVAILSDQDAHETGAFVPFFGRPASTPRGAATFALRSGAVLIFAESYRRGSDRLKVILELVSLEDLPNDQDAAIVELTRRFTERLEEAVRRHPEQWFWMHRRWKTPPPE
jgi:KDO2-lipid IV(A) lauroyltransferase